jgi:hypothetical protein
MKQKDLVLISIIVFFSLFISNSIFASPKNRQQQVEVIDPITTNFPTPDNHYFNNQAFDPTKSITIEQNANTDPFHGTQ